MSAEVEGRGGGFGRYQGLTLAEIQSLFETCIADPSMRSVSAVLRITREQLDARGQLGIYPVFAWCAGAICTVSVGVRFLGPEKTVEGATKVALGAIAALVLLLVSTLPNREVRKVNLQQERLIREMAVQALIEILAAEPVVKPLTYEQQTTVKILLKKVDAAEAIRVLL